MTLLLFAISPISVLLWGIRHGLPEYIVQDVCPFSQPRADGAIQSPRRCSWQRTSLMRLVSQYSVSPFDREASGEVRVVRHRTGAL